MSAGRPAREAARDLVRASRDFLARTDAERLLLFRRHLRLRVCAASPLLLEAVPRAVILKAVNRLRPPSSWPRRPLPRLDMSLLERGVRRRPALPGPSWPPGPRVTDFERWCRRLGAEVSVPHGDGVRLAVRVADDCLDLCMLHERALLSTRGGAVLLELPLELPETLRMGLAGVPLGDLVAHPLLEGRAYPIVEVTCGWGRSLILARTGLVPFAMPLGDGPIHEGPGSSGQANVASGG